MSDSTEIYRNLPAYARLMDDGQVLRHFCDALQPEFDTMRKQTQRIVTLLDPELTQDDWFSYLQQFVGGGPIGDQWLGLGLNPDWDRQAKERFVNQIWTYWQIKGTEWGIRQAVLLWLLWEPALQGERLVINLPLGKNSTAFPSQWYGWGDPYQSNWAQRWDQIQRFGNGSYPQRYKASWFSYQSDTWPWQYEGRWDDLEISKQPAPEIPTIGSAMGRHHAWMHFYVADEFEWNQIYPDVITLNPEIWSAQAVPTTLVWLEDDSTDPVILQPSPIETTTAIVWDVTPDGFRWGDRWPYTRFSESTPILAANQMVDAANVVPTFSVWVLETATQALEAFPCKEGEVLLATTADQTLDATEVRLLGQLALETASQAADAETENAQVYDWLFMVVAVY